MICRRQLELQLPPTPNSRSTVYVSGWCWANIFAEGDLCTLLLILPTHCNMQQEIEIRNTFTVLESALYGHRTSVGHKATLPLSAH